MIKCSCDLHITAGNEIAWSAGCAGHSHQTRHVVDIILYGCHLDAVLAPKLDEEEDHATSDLQW